MKSKVKKGKKNLEKITAEVFNQNGELIEEVELPSRIFGLQFNPDLVHQVFRVQLANSRQVLANTKTRAEVRGGGRKPWRQKGTGRARHGSIRSPLWRGGGVVFGPTKKRNFKLKINKKMKRQALFMVLSAKKRDNELILINDLNIPQPKTKLAASIFQNLKSKVKKDLEKGVLVVLDKKDENFFQASRNLSFVRFLPANSLNIIDLLSLKYLLMTPKAVQVIEKTYKSF